MTARPSQLNQDLKCLEYFNHKRDGYFVDIGSHDGKDLSNTYRLEKEYGWKGICVEPLEEEFKKCVESRPSSICVNTCIYDHNGTVRFNQVTRGNNYNMLSGIDDENYKCRENFIQVEKPCITLTKLLEDNNCPSVIDFLSIDTEGSELKILKGLDHNKFSFRYLTCEHNYDNEKRKDIKEYLESVGYNFYMENQWDDIFIKV
tara:strand:+ start:1286 stop:1894 length:609 start_codon:yes stop_codon:yes gene_type:complete